jgi:hypothetical protein
MFIFFGEEFYFLKVVFFLLMIRKGFSFVYNPNANTSNRFFFVGKKELVKKLFQQILGGQNMKLF